jgi:hypothetical protein
MNAREKTKGQLTMTIPTTPPQQETDVSMLFESEDEELEVLNN